MGTTVPLLPSGRRQVHRHGIHGRRPRGYGPAAHAGAREHYRHRLAAEARRHPARRLMPFEGAILRTIVAFLESLDIPVCDTRITHETLVPGVDIHDGGLIV